MIRTLTILFALLLICNAATFAQDYWWETEISSEFRDLDRLQAVDFDMDGDPDILAHNTSWDDPVFWWENDGNAVFARHELDDLPDSLTQVLVIDFDQDGDQDMLTVRARKSVLWLENTGGLTFEAHTLISNSAQAFTFSVSDFDNDSDLDLLVAGTTGWPIGVGRVYWLEATGDGYITTHQLLEDATFERVVAADLDNDGDMDLITAEQTLEDPYYRLVPYENNGDFTFTAHDVLAVGSNRVQIYCVDMDLDGDLDLVPSYFYATPYNYTLWYRAEGGFSYTPQEYTELGISESVACVADIDEDGDPDLILQGAPTAAYINDGSGNLTAEVISTFSANLCADVADLDGDGSLDIVHGTRCDELVWSKRSFVEQPITEFALANSVSNFGGYSEPNELLPSGEFPKGSGIYYFWGCDFWVGAKTGDEHHVSHSDYGNYEFQPSESGGGGRPDHEHVTLGDGVWQYECSYDDFEPVGGHTPLGLQVDQTVIAPRSWQGPVGAHLVQQTLTNTSNTQLDSVYAGWKFDMDLASGPNGDPDDPHIDDMCSYDPDTQIAYMWDSDDPQTPWDDTGEFGWIPGYAGIKLLDGPTETAAFQWWDWDGDPATDLEKFQYMAGIHPGSNGAFKAEPDTVWDYRVLITTGPFTLMPGESVDLAMTYAVGYGFDGLVDTTTEMENFWLSAPETQQGSQQPLTLSLGDPYPNPFNASVMIPFQLDQRGHATIAVTDILGRRVATLLNGVRSPGQHRVTFTGDDLASGVYFVTLTSGERSTQARKVVFMK
ncbi:T9SS type A sorting domain-containing protein [bacterium]|nr:T9SS type A sorting domain-containing protein [bacterium]